MILLSANQTIPNGGGGLDTYTLFIYGFWAVGLMFVLFGIPAIIWFWKVRMPKAARTLASAAWQRKPPLLLVHDSGRGELTKIVERRGEGIVMTDQNKYKILPRYGLRTPLTQLLASLNTPETVDSAAAGEAIADGNDMAEAATSEGSPPSSVASSQQPPIKSSTRVQINLEHLKTHFILDYSDWILKRTNLIGLDLPLFVGYTGKLCILNPEALALYEAGKMAIQTEDSLLFDPNNTIPEGDKAHALTEALRPLMLLDPRVIQQIIYEGYDQSQIAGVVADSEERARIGMGIFGGKMKWILILAVGAAAALAAIYFVPGLLHGASTVGH